MTSSTSLVGTTFFGIDLRKLSERLQGMRRHVSKRVLLLEFDAASLRLAEARFSGGGLQVDHLTRFDLPEDALERGVPSDAVKMGGLIKQLCREKQISVHRCAVVLPTEIAFQRLIQLPLGLSVDEARDYLLDPANRLQIPIALGQADFDLQPTLLPVLHADEQRLQTYLLTAIPSNLIDRLIQTLQSAQLELQALEVGGHSQLRLMAMDLLTLKQQDVRLVLELKSECTHFTLVTASGPLCFERLAAIRDFPDPILTDEQTLSALDEGVSADQISINQENYIAIGELDLRLLLSEIRDALNRFSTDWSGFRLVDIALTGRNSAHPFLPALLKEEFDCPVHAVEPILVPGIEGLQFDSILVQKGLNRLLGLGLGLLSSDYLLSCDLPEQPSQDRSTRPIPLVDVLSDPVSVPVEHDVSTNTNAAVEQSDLSILSPALMPDQQSSLDQLPHATVVVAADTKDQASELLNQAEVHSSELSDPSMQQDQTSPIHDLSPDELTPFPKADSTDNLQSSWPTISNLSASMEDDPETTQHCFEQSQPLGVSKDNTQLIESGNLIDLEDMGSASEESLKSLSRVTADDREVLDNNIDPQWPSINAAVGSEEQSDDVQPPQLLLDPSTIQEQEAGFSEELASATEDDLLLGDLKFNSDD